ncbi:MAG TPA: DUF4166 domain-containing protein [Terriglobales bacterium]|nr:DUF4166 domain-containing protein [Terriglobales bacterium]
MASGTSAALYPSLLGAAWTELDPKVQRMHGLGRAQGAGVFRVQRGRVLLARLTTWLLGFPRAGEAVPTRLAVRSELRRGVSCEIWQRDFGGQELVSRQYPGRDGLLAERFGCLELCLRLRAQDGALLFQPAGSALALGALRVRLPGMLSPRVNAEVAAGAGDRVQVSVRVEAPLAGLLLAYAGYLDMEEAQP